MISSILKRCFSPTHKNDSTADSNLQLEQLETRLMLSTVSIFASGQTGDESMTVFAGAEEVTFQNISTEGDVFTIEVDFDPAGDGVFIEFINDLYLPEEGYDRNLTVEKIVVDGETIFSTDAEVFAAGVWDPESGQIVDGYGLGPTLHTDGFFDFLIENQETQFVDFSNRTWEVAEGVGTEATLSVNGNDELLISGINGPLAISTQIEIEPDQIYNLDFAYQRIINQGQLSLNSQAWATVGINYYGAGGALVGQDRVDVNSTTAQSVNREIITPDNATDAYLWIWINEFSQGVDIPLQVSNLSLESLDVSEDTTPPTAEFSSFTFSTTFDNEIAFGVLFSDETALRFDQIFPGTISVIAPNGTRITPPIVTGAPGPTPLGQISVFGWQKPDRSAFNSLDNGVYTIVLNENQLIDVAGNVAEAQTLGTITIDIPLVED